MRVMMVTGVRPRAPKRESGAGVTVLPPVLVVPNFFRFRMMVSTVFLGIVNAADIFWYPSPDLCIDTILSRSTMDNSCDLMAWSLL